MASDVAARGLDISSVTTVVHYDVARVSLFDLGIQFAASKRGEYCL